MKKMLNYIKLMRPKHYLKNVLVFVPAMYAEKLIDGAIMPSVVLAFVALCLVASGVYAANDIADAAKDAAHPVNKKRPIASGAISKPAAAVFAVFLFAAGLSLAFFTAMQVFYFVAAYAVLFLAYSFWLKHLAVIDCFCIATGFVLRIYIGGAAMSIGEMVSEWMFLTITAGSLFMAFGKRRGEMVQTSEPSARRVLNGYNLEFLNGIIFACAGVTVVFYALWARSNLADLMIFTVPLVVFIICKYLLNIHKNASYGDPITVIFADKVLLSAIALFALLSLLFLYGV